MSVEKDKFQISPANSSDLDCLLAIEEKGHVSPWSRQMLSDSLSASYICKKLVNGKDIIGFFILLDGEDFGEILNIVIAPTYQGKGLGRELISILIREAVSRGFERVFLEVRTSNKIARKLYHSVGFEQVGVRKNYYRTCNGKEDGLVMELDLSN